MSLHPAPLPAHRAAGRRPAAGRLRRLAVRVRQPRVRRGSGAPGRGRSAGRRHRQRVRAGRPRRGRVRAGLLRRAAGHRGREHAGAVLRPGRALRHHRPRGRRPGGRVLISRAPAAGRRAAGRLPLVLRPGGSTSLAVACGRRGPVAPRRRASPAGRGVHGQLRPPGRRAGVAGGGRLAGARAGRGHPGRRRRARRGALRPGGAAAVPARPSAAAGHAQLQPSGHQRGLWSAGGAVPGRRFAGRRRCVQRNSPGCNRPPLDPAGAGAGLRPGPHAGAAGARDHAHLSVRVRGAPRPWRGGGSRAAPR